MNSFIVDNITFEIDERYQYIKKLGAGSYGIVICAYDRVDKKYVAIKKINDAF